MSFKSRYFYMMLGALSVLLSVAVLLNVSTLSFAENLRQQSLSNANSLVFLPVVSNTDAEVVAASNKDGTNDSVGNSAELPTFDPFGRRVDELMRPIDSDGELLYPYNNPTEDETLTNIPLSGEFPTPSPYTEEQITDFEESIQGTGTWHSSGPTTAGKPLNIMGRYLDMPEDFYVKVHIIAGICTPLPSGEIPYACPQTPLYVLADLNSDAAIRVSGANAQVFLMEDRTIQQDQEDIQKFAWLIEQLESLGIMQPIVIPLR